MRISPRIMASRRTVASEASKQAPLKKSVRGRYSRMIGLSDPTGMEVTPTVIFLEMSLGGLFDRFEGGKHLLHDGLRKSDVAEFGSNCLTGGQSVGHIGFHEGSLIGRGIVLFDQQPAKGRNGIIIGTLRIGDKGAEILRQIHGSKC